MRTRSFFFPALLLVFALSLSSQGQTGTEITLYTFTGGADGSTPQSGLAFGPTGSLFGDTYFGATTNNTYCETGCGTVFQLTPGSGGGPWTFETLHTFAGGASDYGHPTFRPAFDAAGNLWGTAFEWGPGGFGGVFELLAASNWSESLIYNFSSSTGVQPSAGLTAYNGSWYGTTQFGRGFVNNGQVFSLSPASGGQWNENVVHAFSAGADGYEPQTELLFDQKGNIYGSTPYGGPSGSGDIFTLSPVAGGKWKETVIYNFPFYNLGFSFYPSTLIFDPQGNLYGTTGFGGTGTCDVVLGCGTLFELQRVGNSWQETTLYEFLGGTDGEVPTGGLLLDSHGNLYGITLYGGTGSCTSGQLSGCGTVFQLSKTNGAWQKSTVYNFTGIGDGAFPIGTLVSDSAGNLYGVTEGYPGSVSQYGTVFEIVP